MSKDMAPQRLSLLGLLFVVLGSLAPAVSEAWIPCTDFFFNVTTASFNDSGVIEPAASYSISATYCPPTQIVLLRPSAVQLLVHGGTSNKLYWSAFAPVGSSDQVQPANYSYVDFVRAQGYSTIAIDRLGCGNSSHPDPTLVRISLEVEQLRVIIQQIRNFGLIPLLPLFNKLILVSRAYGAAIVNILLNKYPTELVDATIFTAYVHVFNTTSTVVASQTVAPASTVFPSRFGGLDPGYFTFSNQTTVTKLFFGPDGGFDPIVGTIQYSREDAQASGEAASLKALLFTSSFSTDTSAYAGAVAVMIGQEDEVYCAGNCGTGSSSFTAVTQSFFPNARLFTGFQVENTGHFLPYHYTALQGFTLLVEWLSTSVF